MSRAASAKSKPHADRPRCTFVRFPLSTTPARPPGATAGRWVTFHNSLLGVFFGFSPARDTAGSTAAP